LWVFEIHGQGDIEQTRLVTGLPGYQMFDSLIFLLMIGGPEIQGLPIGGFGTMEKKL
jgi:hypothetical protein